MFLRFVKKCKKYKFNFAINTSVGLTLILRPINTFESIRINENSYWKLFLKAIREMKKYRKGEKC